MKRILFFAFLLLNKISLANDVGTVNYSRSEWRTFVECLLRVQKKYPSLYKPVEFVRFDLLPQQELLKLVTTYSKKCHSGLNLRHRADLESAKDAISEEANTKLKELTESQKSKLNSVGTYMPSIRGLPEDLRTRLVPLDDLYLKSSEIGKKIKADLSAKNLLADIDVINYDVKNKIIHFDSTALKTSYEYSLRSIPSPLSGPLLRVRGTFFGVLEPFSKDLSLDPGNLSGTFFYENVRSSDLFGNFPNTQNRWVDEKGVTHFHGDGHKH